MQRISNYTRTDLALGCLGIHPIYNIDKQKLTFLCQLYHCRSRLKIKQTFTQTIYVPHEPSESERIFPGQVLEKYDLQHYLMS